MRVLTMGTFDLIHPGHISLLNHCRQIAGPDGKVIATVNRDEFVERYKGRRPVMGQDDRRRVLGAIHDVDHAYVHMGDEDASGTILEHRADVIVIGEDWADRDYLGQLGVTQEWLSERGVTVLYVPLLPGYSSTALRERAA